MAEHFSVRDVNFHSSTKGVRIIVYTDVPCHLWCRQTKKEPHIHTKPVYRRGMWLNDDVRFCFTVFTDFEQYEAGDTLIHTFWKIGWPVCTTEWLYFFASVSGVFSVSTSPLFEWHNDGIDPVSPPRVLRCFETIEPESGLTLAPSVWTTNDLTAHVAEGATGAIFQLINRAPVNDRGFGLRKHGSTFDKHSEMYRSSMTWACCGLDSDYKCDIWVESTLDQEIWLMGYTGPQVVFFDMPRNIAPPIANAFHTVDLSGIIPGAVAVIVDIGKHGGGFHLYSIRKFGSTDDHYWYYWHNWPIIGVDDLYRLELKSFQVDAAHLSAYVVGYITDKIVCRTNGLEIVGIPNLFWTRRNMKANAVNPIWAVVEVQQTIGNRAWGVQKGFSLRKVTEDGYMHEWAYPHLTPGWQAGFYKQDTSVHFWHMSEIES